MQDNQQQLPLVSLLIAVVVLFGVVWSQDTGLARKEEPANSSIRGVASSGDQSEDQDSDRTASQDFYEITVATACAIPLPERLTPGRYRIVNSRGRSWTDSYSAEGLTETGIKTDLPSKNLYEMEQNGVRWYYIRIDSSFVEAEESETFSVTRELPLVAPRPRRRIALRRMLSSSFHTVRSSIASGYRLAADGVKATVDHVVRTPARFLEKLVNAIREHEEEKRFPNTSPLSPAEIDTASSLDSIFY